MIIIPDTHGRSFWKEAVEKHSTEDIIFLGDYLDPYPVEGISPDKALANFEEILEFTKAHANCQLLLGNHDLHYICNFGEACRMDMVNSFKIHSLLMDNLWLFKIIALRELGGKKVVFSHAPILKEWVEAVGESDNIDVLSVKLNSLLNTISKDPWEAERYLGQISAYRSGYDTVGSPVWADVREIGDNIIQSVDYSVFGHTQLATGPIITEKWACLDCRRAFKMDDNLKITPID